jgi:hypothetical protein
MLLDGYKSCFLSKKVREGTKPRTFEGIINGFLLAKKKRFTGFQVLPFTPVS